MTGSQTIGSAKPMCAACQAFFTAWVAKEGVAVAVGDPGGVHVFLPDRRHLLVPHPGR